MNIYIEHKYKLIHYNIAAFVFNVMKYIVIFSLAIWETLKPPFVKVEWPINPDRCSIHHRNTTYIIVIIFHFWFVSISDFKITSKLHEKKNDWCFLLLCIFCCLNIKPFNGCLILVKSAFFVHLHRCGNLQSSIMKHFPNYSILGLRNVFYRKMS